MRQDIESILYDAECIHDRVLQVGTRITRDYQDKDLLLVGVLKGSFVFLADLARSIDLPVEVDFMVVSSYGSGTESSGVLTIAKDLSVPVDGRHVLIVEDIVDSGLTLSLLAEDLRSRGAASVQVAVPTAAAVHATFFHLMFPYSSLNRPPFFSSGFFQGCGLTLPSAASFCARILASYEYFIFNRSVSNSSLYLCFSHAMESRRAFSICLVYKCHIFSALACAGVFSGMSL